MNIIVYAVLALAVMGMIGAGTYKVKKWGADEVRAEWKDANAKAETQARTKEAKDRETKEKADEENRATRARLDADIAKLRRERDSRRPAIVPAAPSGSKCPEGLACFDGPGLESALRAYRSDLRGLADEAAAVEADLNTARKWAQGR